jgi:hypothetical protein
MPIGNPKSMQAWDGVKYLGQLYAYAETSLEKGAASLWLKTLGVRNTR